MRAPATTRAALWVLCPLCRRIRPFGRAGALAKSTQLFDARAALKLDRETESVALWPPRSSLQPRAAISLQFLSVPLQIAAETGLAQLLLQIRILERPIEDSLSFSRQLLMT